MAEQQTFTFTDPDNVQEVLVTGPCNAARPGDLVLLTCTAARPDINSMFSGVPANNAAVVVSRLIFPADLAREIVRILNDQLAKPPGGPATSGRMN